MNGTSEGIRLDVAAFLRERDPNNRLTPYFELLARENSRVNIVSRETLPPTAPSGRDRFEGLRRLTAESIYPITELHRAQTRSYLDIGSGGGFPAIPIVLTATISDTLLVERTRKKAAALRRILMELQLRAEICTESFESLVLKEGSCDLITLRLVRLTDRLAARILPLLAPGGDFVYYALADISADSSRFLTRQLRFTAGGGRDFHTATIVTRKPE
ncbi:MAG TPA: class I SAM-dependent methyltransferase [candidate division Zixibacteria bacterium]|nr:class I SAM-dependent methyltransferase [candidate division Zixibacteria bacterium]MDD4917301.1 class I SAM-dependent methyltransferase [candidate division Zixibacteria bacterium]MDM7971551.1 class I SAM-dependent methyltransferase [candidate division Zixibacteria bacterium]HOD65455.1 class I SAM-dependent methyltransferase [candidate division Zixibacteria bacterium]HOZ07741.1 class I SAM-dependent methyltransferase [candidate division Zixibacteria bacterium]